MDSAPVCLAQWLWELMEFVTIYSLVVLVPGCRLRCLARSRRFKTHEFSSGFYQSEEASHYNADQSSSAYEMDLSKSNLSARYSKTSFNCIAGAIS